MNFEKSCFYFNDSASIVVIVNGGMERVEDSAGVGQMPTAFSPNGDGVNDYFRPFRQGKVRVIQFEIYDRWGRQVWSAIGSEGARGWDGTSNGYPASIGTYFYVTELEDLLGRRFSYRGDVTLVR